VYTSPNRGRHNSCDIPAHRSGATSVPGALTQPLQAADVGYAVLPDGRGGTNVECVVYTDAMGLDKQRSLGKRSRPPCIRCSAPTAPGATARRTRRAAARRRRFTRTSTSMWRMSTCAHSRQLPGVCWRPSAPVAMQLPTWSPRFLEVSRPRRKSPNIDGFIGARKMGPDRHHRRQGRVRRPLSSVSWRLSQRMFSRSATISCEPSAVPPRRTLATSIAVRPMSSSASALAP